MKVDRKRGGAPNGRNPMLATATIYNARGMVLGKYKAKSSTPVGYGKIRQLSEAKVRAEEKKIERIHGRLTMTDKSVHTVASKAGEVDSRLDKLAAGELGWAKRVVTRSMTLVTISTIRATTRNVPRGTPATPWKYAISRCQGL